nr:reverse transcriptase domain-containing protein [Tanacetum cinerariifolium]
MTELPCSTQYFEANIESTVFNDEEVTMTMAQKLIKMKAKKARLLDEQMAKKLHDEEVKQAAEKEKQEKDDFEKAKVLQQHSSQENMIVYLKNMAGYKMEHFKDEEPTKKRVAKETLLQESFKKLKAVEVLGSHSTQDTPTSNPKEMSKEDVKNMLEIIPVSEFKVEALQVKVTQAYQSFEDMLKDFDREDLDALWRLVKEKFSTTVPTFDKEKALWVELKRLFKPNKEDVLWKLQRYMHYPIRDEVFIIGGMSVKKVRDLKGVFGCVECRAIGPSFQEVILDYCRDCHGDQRMEMLLARSTSRVAIRGRRRGVVLNDEQWDFLAESLEEINDCEDLQLQAIINFKADNVDAYYSDCDDKAIANAIFMTNLSPVGSINGDIVEPCYDSDILSQIPHYGTYRDTDVLNSSVQEMGYIENIVSNNESYDELTSNSNVISYADYIVSIGNDADNYIPPPEQINDMILFVIEQLKSQVEKYNMETLRLAEESRLKMIEKQTEINAKPVDYVKLNKLYEYFVPEKQLSAKQLYWSSTPSLLQIETEPINAYFKNNSDVHQYYLKVTKEHVATLQELLEEARALKPLDEHIGHASKFAERIQELLVVSSTNASGSKPRSNTKNDRIRRTSSRSKKNKLEAQPRKFKSSDNKNNNVSDCNANVKNEALSKNFNTIFLSCNECEPSSLFDFEEGMNNNQNQEPPPQNGPPPMTQMTSLTNSNLELKNMFGHFMKMNIASSSGTGSLLSITILNPQEDLKAITTRSGVTLVGPSVPPSSSKVVDREPEMITDQVLTGSSNNVPPLGVQPSPASTNSSSKMPEVTKDTVQPIYEEYIQEVLGFSNNSKSGNPTPSLDPIIALSSPSLTPFEGGDFILEKIEAGLTSESIPLRIDDTDLDLEGDIYLLEELLNNDPSLSPLPPKELNIEEIKTVKSSIDEPSELELK